MVKQHAHGKKATNIKTAKAKNARYAAYVRKAITVFCVICMVYTAAPAEADTRSILDDITQEEQLEAVAEFRDDPRFIGKETGLSAYDNMLVGYLEHLNIRTDDRSGKYPAEWVQETLAIKGTVEPIPDELTAPDEISEFIQENADAGDLLFYRVNGMADKCLVYLGDGKTVTRVNQKLTVTDIPASFVVNEKNRTPSTGIFAYAHLWKQTAATDESADISFVLNANAETFTGNSYALYVQTGTGDYAVCRDYVVVEKTPGVYTLWDGNEFGLEISSWQYGHTIILEKKDNTTVGIPERIKIDLDNAYQTDSGEYFVSIPAD